MRPSNDNEPEEHEPATLYPVDPRSLPVRFSRLKQFRYSAAHYHELCQYEPGQGIAQRVGTAVHAMVLGKGHSTNHPPVIRYDGRRAGNDWQRFAADHADQIILSPGEYAETMAMVGSVRRHHEAMQLLHEDTIIEAPIAWRHLGRDCQSTPDAYNVRWVAELKTSQTSHPVWFVREALRYYYHVQLAAYRMAIEHVHGAAPGAAYVVAVEKRPPYCVTCFRLTDRTLDAGAALWREWFERLTIAEQSNHWPGYADSIVDFDLPDLDLPVEIEADGKLLEA